LIIFYYFLSRLRSSSCTWARLFYTAERSGQRSFKNCCTITDYTSLRISIFPLTCRARGLWMWRPWVDRSKCKSLTWAPLFVQATKAGRGAGGLGTRLFSSTFRDLVIALNWMNLHTDCSYNLCHRILGTKFVDISLRADSRRFQPEYVRRKPVLFEAIRGQKRAKSRSGDVVNR